MKRFLWIVAVALTGCSTPPATTHAPGLPQYTVQTSSNGQITNYEASGNLQANDILGCVPVSAVTNKHTPADIYPGVADCVKAGDYEKATQLFAVAGTFGRFDQLRVSDRSARQAIRALQINAFADLTEEQRENFKKVMLPMLQVGSSGLSSLCSTIGRIGPPDYVPSYMIQHGMGAFLGRSDSGLDRDFEPGKGWKESLSGYIHCS